MRRRFFKRPTPTRVLANRQIKSSEVRLIDEEGNQLGLVGLEKALQMAQERNLDLVQVTEKVNPPVCKITEYGKFLYQKQKKDKKGKKSTHTGEVKGIRLSFSMSEHDLGIRANQSKKFLEKGYKVKVEMNLRGRQKALGDFAKKKIEKFLEVLGETVPCKIEKELKREARGLTIIISRKT